PSFGSGHRLRPGRLVSLRSRLFSPKKRSLGGGRGAFTAFFKPPRPTPREGGQKHCLKLRFRPLGSGAVHGRRERLERRAVGMTGPLWSFVLAGRSLAKEVGVRLAATQMKVPDERPGPLIAI